MKNKHLTLIYAVTAALFCDVTTGGINNGDQGVIANQTLLLQEIGDGLSVYNQNPDPIIERLSRESIRQVERISQTPLAFGRHTDGVKPLDSKQAFRTLTTPLGDYDLSTEYTVKALQDMLVSDVRANLDGAMAGDAELLNALFFQAIFTKRTAGAIGADYEPSFYNGETDVPRYKTNTFSAAHYHYLGINSTTLTPQIWEDTKQDLQHHGFGTTAGSIVGLFNSADVDLIMTGLADSNAANGLLQAITAMRERAIDYGVFNTGVVVRGVTISVTDDVPAGYFAMLDQTQKLMTRRVHLDPAYRGLMMFREGQYSPEFPLSGLKFMRRVGFRPRLLGACTVRQIVASTSYTNPTWAHPALA